MSETMDSPPWTKPPEGQTSHPHARPKGKSYAHAAKGKGKIQMTNILSEYIRIKKHANNNQEIWLKFLAAKWTTMIKKYRSSPH